MPWIRPSSSMIPGNRKILAGDFVRDNQSFSPSTTAASPAGGSRISPAVLFVIVILAVIFFISGLLHLLVRFLIKSSPSADSAGRRYPGEEALGPEALQRQLQQLFHLHDSGLDQAFIDTLPVFLYGDMVADVGGKGEPFDCAVCLCEFAAGDKLRLLPVCSHAFHIACIDAWLLCNSTCPLCRATLFVPGQPIENPAFDLLDDDDDAEKRIFPVRLGKFRNVAGDNDGDGGGGAVRREEGETSSSCLGARRCYSMGSYQYVVGDPQLRIALTKRRKRKEAQGLSSPAADGNGKRIWAGSKDESFSVSKIWQWSNHRGTFPDAAGNTSSLDGGPPWAPAAGGRSATTADS